MKDWSSGTIADYRSAPTGHDQEISGRTAATPDAGNRTMPLWQWDECTVKRKSRRPGFAPVPWISEYQRVSLCTRCVRQFGQYFFNDMRSGSLRRFLLVM